jgi:flagellar hook assembly protein FlgD
MAWCDGDEAKLDSKTGYSAVRGFRDRQETAICFELRGSDRVRAVVYDAAGRRVRGLCDQLLPAGSHDLPWDGRDDAGVRVEAGVYWVRLALAGGEGAHRLVLVR